MQSPVFSSKSRPLPRRRFLSPLEKAIQRERIRLVLLNADGTVSTFNGMGANLAELSGERAEIDWGEIVLRSDSATRYRRVEGGVMVSHLFFEVEANEEVAEP